MPKRERLASDISDVGNTEADHRPRHVRLSASGDQRSPEEQKNVVQDAVPPEPFGCEAVAVEVELHEVPFSD